MEFSIDKHTFLTGLYKVQGIIDKKKTLNVLSHILFSAQSDGGIQITATDYDVIVVGDYPAEVIEPGKLAVSGRSLFDVVKALPDRPIQLRKTENNWAEIKCGRSQFKITGISSDDFPEFQPNQDISSFSVPKEVLLKMIDRTIFSISMDEARMALNGVFFRVQPNQDGTIQLTMVSTDGHRLSKVEETIECATYKGDAASAIIHRKGIFELKRILEGPDDEAHIAFNVPNVIFQSDNNTMFIRQIEESYPDYDKVIPVSTGQQAKIHRDSFIDSIRRISTLTPSKASIIKLELNTGKLILSTSNPETGEGRDEVDIDYTGESFTLGFNFRYILDVLSVIETEEVIFEINDQFSPGVLRSLSDTNAAFVIMPMRI